MPSNREILVTLAVAAIGLGLTIALVAEGETSDMMVETVEWDNPVSSDHGIYDATDDLYDDRGSDRDYQAFEASSPAFDDAFPEYELFAVYHVDWWPWTLHFVAWDADDEIGYDLTMNYTGLLEDSDSAILTNDDAETYAAAYFTLANPEILHRHTLVNSSDSDALGHDIHDMTTTSTVPGWNVTASAWSPRNGQLVNMTADFSTSSVQQSSWTVWDTGTGPATPNRGDARLVPGDHIVNRYENGYQRHAEDSNGNSLVFRANAHDTSYEELATAEAFDGTNVTAKEPTNAQKLSDPAFASKLPGAGVQAYDQLVQTNHDPTDRTCGSEENPNPNGGFHVNTTDCEIEILVNHPFNRVCSACAGVLFDEEACAGKIYISSDYHDEKTDEHWGDDATREQTASNVVSHELFHILQCQTLWDHAEGTSGEEPGPPVLRPTWGPMFEGQARFVESLMAPDLETHDDSLYFDQEKGVNAFVQSPWEDMCNWDREYAGYWKHLTTQTLDLDAPDTHIPEDAGQLLRDVLENAEDLAFKSRSEQVEDERKACEEQLPQFVNDTLAHYDTATHDTHTQTLENLTLELLAPTDAWTYDNNNSDEEGPLDWATHLDPVTNETITSVGNYTPGSLDPTVDEEIGAWGMHYFQLNETALADSQILNETANVRCSDETGDGAWSMRLVNLTDGQIADPSRDIHSCEEDILVDLTDDRAAVIAATRTAAEDGIYSVAVEEP